MNLVTLSQGCRVIPRSLVLAVLFGMTFPADLRAQPLADVVPISESDATSDSEIPQTGTPRLNLDRDSNRTPARTLPTRPAIDQAAYILGAGDQVDVTVLGYEEYTGSQTVLPDGNITMPLAGTIPAAGKTAEQLAQDITTRLNQYLVDPVVTVSLQVLRPVVVTVSGEVSRPGPLRLRSISEAELGEFQRTNLPETPTLSMALMQAGGITSFADLRRVELRRYRPNGSSEPMTINLWDAITSNNAPPDMILQDGDSIYVPRLAAGNTVDRRLLARSSFAPDGVRVRVVGEVKQPGEVQVPPNSSLSSAVAIAGGPTVDARLSRVALVRLSESGEIERETIDLRNLTDNYQIQEGDVIFVPKRGTSSFVDFAGRLFNPLGALFNLF